MKNFCRKSTIRTKFFFIKKKKLFLDSVELRLEKVGKQADICILSFFYTL